LAVNFLCRFHALDVDAIKFVDASAKFKQMWRDWGFATPSESECSTEGSVYSETV
jgi:hypothetical protein